MGINGCVDIVEGAWDGPHNGFPFDGVSTKLANCASALGRWNWSWWVMYKEDCQKWMSN